MQSQHKVPDTNIHFHIISAKESEQEKKKKKQKTRTLQIAALLCAFEGRVSPMRSWSRFLNASSHFDFAIFAALVQTRTNKDGTGKMKTNARKRNGIKQQRGAVGIYTYNNAY